MMAFTELYLKAENKQKRWSLCNHFMNISNDLVPFLL